MIFDEGGFVRTLWYGRSQILQKTRKYRGFGGFESRSAKNGVVK